MTQPVAACLDGKLVSGGGSSPGGAVATPPFFEGTEKRIEIDFSGEGDLRKVVSGGWEEVVQLSQTQVLNTKKTDDFTSYLLSESSLIVYPAKLILKTCGNTVPLSGVARAYEHAASVGLEPEWLCYSRKNFLAPSEQPEEHASQETEIAKCRKACRGVGDSYLLGPMTGEHWLLYDAQYKWTDCSVRGEYHIDIMMYGLPADVRQHFFTAEPEGSPAGAAAMTRNSGLGDLVSSIKGEIDDYCFAPCGYSCNVHTKCGAYAMVHVTPQEECSYASFETNFGSLRRPDGQANVSGSLNDLVGKVLDVFRPERFTITLFTDQGAEDAIGGAPFEAADARYTRRTCTSTHFEQDYAATIVNYVAAKANRKRSRVEAASEEDSSPSRRVTPQPPRMLRSRSDSFHMEAGKCS